MSDRCLLCLQVPHLLVVIAAVPAAASSQLVFMQPEHTHTWDTHSLQPMPDMLSQPTFPELQCSMAAAEACASCWGLVGKAQGTLQHTTHGCEQTHLVSISNLDNH